VWLWLCAGLVVDWTGEGLQVWQQRFAAAPGSTTVNQLLRKHGIKVGLCWPAGGYLQYLVPAVAHTVASALTGKGVGDLLR
jgi:hypothetical protein